MYFKYLQKCSLGVMQFKSAEKLLGTTKDNTHKSEFESLLAMGALVQVFKVMASQPLR